ncbi:hypothetical protein MO867_16015 [Microbulbifer sp. OS29]|uniref:Uncharacterized protein n=1 Tax=Microbulbifer okhotskensis TaxID=2926617 RepID=A0A9X2EU46_9GAMM|nr:hypothetical protein [Microbulbifer okhotskensis]MCO1335841.1 hypothetical protein [Microbulbifer okhotskensis]
MLVQPTLLSDLATMIDQGRIRTTMGEYFGKINADNLRKAHQRVES